MPDARKYASVKVARNRSCVFDVALDLRLQLVYAGEFFLTTYSTSEAHIDEEPVQITIEIKQKCLDAALCSPERGGHTDVGARGKLLVPYHNEPGVDATRRDDGFRIGKYVCGRKPDSSAAPVPHHDLSPEHLGTAEEARCLLHPSFGYERPDTGGADAGLLANPPHLYRDGLSAHLLH
jgi:hypothetical protein